MSAIPFDNSYARLPDRFYTRLAPTPVAEPAPIAVNRPLATQLGIDGDWLASEEGTRAIAGNLEYPRAPHQLQRSMPATSSAATIRNWVTVARSCSAR